MRYTASQREESTKYSSGPGVRKTGYSCTVNTHQLSILPEMIHTLNIDRHILLFTCSSYIDLPLIFLQLAINLFSFNPSKRYKLSQRPSACINPLAMELDIYSLVHHLCKL